MNYKLEINPEAMKEWKKLDATIREQFKKRLGKRMIEPHVPSARLHGTDMGDVYKIKLRDSSAWRKNTTASSARPFGQVRLPSPSSVGFEQEYDTNQVALETG